MGQWSKLSAKEKAQIIKFAIDNGVSDINSIRDTYNVYAGGGSIHIDKNKIGTFTAAATKHGKSVQEFARQVLANKENYSPAMVKKANFARNSAKWHKHDGDSDTQYLRTEQPKVVMPSTGKTADISWHQWWFANRQKQLQQNIETVKQKDRERDFTNYFISYPNSPEEDTERMLKALRETKEYVGNAGMMEDSIGNTLARNLLKDQISNYTQDMPDDRVASYLSYIEGVHFPIYNAILYPDVEAPPSPITVIHERTHAADASFPIEAINYFTTAEEANPEYYDTWYKRIFAPLHPKYPRGIFPASGIKDYYLDAPNEVYSRLMEFRELVGANPNYTWTKEDLKKYEAALDKCELRRYSDDDLLKLLNEIAQNNSSFKKSNNSYLAALGGGLKSTGGPLYPFSFQKNPYLKVPAVRYGEGGEKTTPSKAQIVRSAWENENPFNRGLLKNGMYEQYDDPNGEGRDVGPGLLVGATIPDKKLYTRQELDDAAYTFGMEGLASIGKAYNEKYGTEKFPTPFDTVSVAPKLLLLDTRYQNGRLPIANWPSLYQSIADGNWAEALKNSRSTYIKDGVKHYDNDRVRRRAESIFPGIFDVIFTPDSKEFPKVISRKKSKK